MHRPTVAEDCSYTNIQGGPDDLDAGALDGEVLEGVATLEVDREVDVAGDATVVIVHEGAGKEGGKGAANAEGDEGELWGSSTRGKRKGGDG